LFDPKFFHKFDSAFLNGLKMTFILYMTAYSYNP
jgi:hypothetical protein